MGVQVSNQDEYSRFYEFLRTNIVTCSEAAKILGIPQKNLCRYKRELERANRLWIARIGKCPITGCNDVQFITTNPDWKPKDNQLKLFENEETDSN